MIGAVLIEQIIYSMQGFWSALRVAKNSRANVAKIVIQRAGPVAGCAMGRGAPLCRFVEEAFPVVGFPSASKGCERVPLTV